MIYTWTTQVAAVVPYTISGSTAQVTVVYQGQTSAAVSVPIASSAPGIFTLDSTGKGQAAAINQDGFTANTTASPTKIGDVISLYATGEGQTTPSGVDGKPAAVPLPQPNLPVTVTVGGQKVNPEYAGDRRYRFRRTLGDPIGPILRPCRLSRHDAHTHLRQFAAEDLCNSLILLAGAVSDAKM
jgi:uncharacterized protein (TIGR03437 family)